MADSIRKSSEVLGIVSVSRFKRRLQLSRLMSRTALILLGLTASISMANEYHLLVDPSRVVRAKVPASVFGFNIEWMGFDSGYMRSGKVRPELIDYLRPFAGAIYRYPGGTNSSYFDWRRSVGPQDSRAPQTNQWGAKIATKFGFDEYLAFLQEVGGVPLVVVNAWGEKSGRHTASQVSNNARDWLQYANHGIKVQQGQTLSPCAPNSKCAVALWEIGNEMDWGDQSLTAAEYDVIARTIAAQLRRIDPALHLLFGGKSSPWSTTPEAVRAFDEQIGRTSRDFSGGLTYHLYYDGVSIPGVVAYLNRAISAFAAGRESPSFDVFITEHSRWPARPLVGKWKDNWHQATDLSAAISASDFWLSLVPNAKINGLVWHALGAQGPWQLFSIDSDNDSLVPSVPYWAFRVLRAGFLDNIVATQVWKTPSAKYVGGYDIRAIAMSSADERKLSVLAVNRSAQPRTIDLEIPLLKGRSVLAVRHQIAGDNPDLSADPRETSFVALHEQKVGVAIDARGRSRWVLPGFSVTSIVIPTD